MRTKEELEKGLAARDRRRLLAELLRRKASGLRYRHTPSTWQRNLWLLNELDPHSTTFHIGMAIRIVSAVEVAAVRSAGQHLIDRHEMLRSLYPPEVETPYIELHGSMELAFEYVDASSWDDIRMCQEVRRRYAAPFDLDLGPILRITLFTRGAEDHVFLMVVHEIACDGMSMEILLREFIEFYKAESEGLAVSSAQPAFGFTDYLKLHSAAIGGASGARNLEYWLKKLSGEPPRLKFLTDRPPPSTRGVHNAIHRFSVDEELYRRLGALARGQGVTLFAVLMTAYQTLLMRLSGQTDIVVGVPMSGRVRAEYESVVGHFVNGVVVRSTVPSDRIFSDQLAQVWRDIREAVQHQVYPSDQLQRLVSPAWLSGHAPMFQVSLNLVKTQPGNPMTDFDRRRSADEPVFWGPLKIEPYPIELIEDHFKLAMAYELGLRMIDPGDR